LCAELASDPSMREADEEGVDPHEPFDEDILHLLCFLFDDSKKFMEATFGRRNFCF
jgi:hypothetical protein